jgi:hypothetical protein
MPHLGFVSATCWVENFELSSRIGAGAAGPIFCLTLFTDSKNVF